MKAFIEAGAAGVHYEDRLASEKKCGHMGGKVLIPTKTAVRNLVAARPAADLLEVPTLIVAHGCERRAINYERHRSRGRSLYHGREDGRGLLPVTRRRSRAGYRTRRTRTSSGAKPQSLTSPKRSALRTKCTRSIRVNGSPTIARRRLIGNSNSRRAIARLSNSSSPRWAISLSSSPSPASTCSNHSTFQLAKDYKTRGMAAYSELQRAEFDAE